MLVFLSTLNRHKNTPLCQTFQKAHARNIYVYAYVFLVMTAPSLQQTICLVSEGEEDYMYISTGY